MFTLSLHGAKNFPFRKERERPRRRTARRLRRRRVPRRARRARSTRCGSATSSAAGLAFYLAGADPHEGDRLGRLKLSGDGLAERDRRVLDGLRERGMPVAIAMAGGYGRDIDDTVAGAAAHAVRGAGELARTGSAAA